MPAAWFARGARARIFLRRKSAAAKVSCFDFLAENPRVFAIIQAAGWPIWFLLLASVIAVALIIERSIVLRHAKIVPSGLLDKVVDAYRKQGVTPQLLDSLYQDSPLGRVLASGLRNHKAPRQVMKEAIEDEGRAVTHDLERFLTTLGTIRRARTRRSSPTASRSRSTTPASAS
jgi:hypothetical protein